jgi:hypothetical protein
MLEIRRSVNPSSHRLVNYLWHPAQENTVLPPKPIHFGH